MSFMRATRSPLDRGRCRHGREYRHRANTLRDRGCTFPGCDRPASWSDCHHVRHWADGGPTSDHNGVLLCPHHHREIHHGHWDIRFADDGIPEFLPPPWIDPNRTPRRNVMHHKQLQQRS